MPIAGKIQHIPHIGTRHLESFHLEARSQELWLRIHNPRGICSGNTTPVRKMKAGSMCCESDVMVMNPTGGNIEDAAEFVIPAKIS